MRSAASLLLAVVLIAHSVCGLCWRCVETSGGQNASATFADNCDGSCGCHSASTAPPCSDTATRHNPTCRMECSGTCRFLPVERVVVEQPATDFALVTILPESLNTTPAGSTVFERESVVSRGHPPLRLHLLHQLLLI